jgi:DNA-binding NarL/FixJ family response regulator
MSIKLLIVDDHEVVRSGLKAMLADTDIKVTGEAATGEAAVRMVSKQKFDVVLMDVRMPEGDGLSALGRIKSDKPDLPVLIFSNYDSPSYVARSVALSASGYLLKDVGRDKLIESIRLAAAGQSAWSREELRRVTGALTTPRPAAEADTSLTPRESEVLQQLAHGSTNKEIAVELKISYETVKEHVQNILRKIGVTDRTQAAVWAVRKGLV